MADVLRVLNTVLQGLAPSSRLVGDCLLDFDPSDPAMTLFAARDILDAQTEVEQDVAQAKVDIKLVVSAVVQLEVDALAVFLKHHLIYEF